MKTFLFLAVVIFSAWSGFARSAPPPVVAEAAQVDASEPRDGISVVTGIDPHRHALQEAALDWERYMSPDLIAIPAQAPALAINMEYADGRAWKLALPLIWTIGDTDVDLVVPANFVHDSTSTPRLFWGIVPRSGQYTRAAIIHDYLYWSQVCTRQQADNLMMVAMKESGVDWGTRTAIYAAVDTAGGRAWDENAEEKKRGLPRFDPGTVKGPNLNWPAVRIELVRSAYRDPPIADRGAYCQFGNASQVPGG